MASNWSGFKRGQLYDVPLHDNNRQYTSVSTGLVKVQQDRMNKGFSDWLHTLRDPNFPPMTYPDHATHPAINGCTFAL